MTKVAIITGASRGLGYTLASFLAAKGDTLVLTGRNEVALEQAATKLRGNNNRIITVPGDIRDEQFRQTLKQTAQKIGHLDYLINNASSLGPSPQPQLKDYPLESLRQVFETNVFAPLALSQNVLPLLKQSNGLIINISSDAAIGAYEGWGGYGSSKAALDLVSATLANELEKDNVAVVSVDPGDMRTEMHQEAFPNQDISDRPLPEVTLPFWAWLLNQNLKSISGQRFQAQADTWLVEKETVSL